MVSKPELTIESPEVIRAINNHKHQMAELVPWRHPELTVKQRYSWHLLSQQKLAEELVQLGFWKEVKVPLPVPVTDTYIDKVKAWRNNAISEEGFVNWCFKNSPSIIFDGAVRLHQRQFGKEETGYQPSEKFLKGRLALTKYQEAQRGVSPLAHTPLFEQLKQEVVEAGFDNLEQFLEVNEALP